MSERRVAGRQVFTAGTQPLSFSAQEITSVPPLWLQAFLPAGLSSGGMGVLLGSSLSPELRSLAS